MNVCEAVTEALRENVTDRMDLLAVGSSEAVWEVEGESCEELGESDALADVVTVGVALFNVVVVESERELDAEIVELPTVDESDGVGSLLAEWEADPAVDV